MYHLFEISKRNLLVAEKELKDGDINGAYFNLGMAEAYRYSLFVHNSIDALNNDEYRSIYERVQKAFKKYSTGV